MWDFLKSFIQRVPNPENELAAFKNDKICRELTIQSTADEFRKDDKITITKTMHVINAEGSVISNQYINTARREKKKGVLPSVCPYALDEIFGRDETLNELEILLFESGIVAVCGLPGVGKTQFALYFAWKHKSKFKNLYYMNAKSELEDSYHEIARRMNKMVKNCDIKYIVDNVYSCIKENETSALFIIDDAIGMRSIKQIVPPKTQRINSDIYFLILSHYCDWGDDIPTIILKPLSEDHALDLLLSILKEKRFNTESRWLWKRLVNLLNCLPLAIQIICAGIREEIDKAAICGKFQLTKFIQDLKNEKDNLIKKNFPRSSDNEYPHSIYVALKMIIPSIYREEYSNLAFDLLYTISFMGNEYYEKRILLKIMPEEDLKEALAILMKFSLVNERNMTSRRPYFGVNKLVQWAFRCHQQEIGIQKKYYAFVLRFIHERSYESYSFPFRKSILSHEKKFVDLINDYVKQNDLEKSIGVLAEQDCINSLNMIFETQITGDIKTLIDNNDWLNIVSENGCVNTLKMFFEHKVDVQKHFNKSYHQTASHVAAGSLHPEVLRLILKQNVLADPEDNEQFTPIHSAVLANMYTQSDEDSILECIGLLIKLKGSNINAKDKYGKTPLMHAVSIRSKKFINELIKMGANLQAIDINEQTILFHACDFFNGRPENEIKRKEMVQFLIDLGAQINILDSKKRSLLHHSAESHSSLLLDLFLRQNLSVNGEDCDGNTPLLYLGLKPIWDDSVQRNAISCINVLTKYGAKISSFNHQKQTIMHLAAKQHSVIILEYLIKTHKFKINICDINNNTPIHSITEGKVRGYNSTHAFKTLELLVSYNGDLNLNNFRGRNVLHLAAERFWSKFVNGLIMQYKMNVDIKDNYGQTPLHRLLNQDQNVLKKEKRWATKTLRVLIENGANIHETDKNGITPLELALECEIDDLKEAIVLLAQ